MLSVYFLYDPSSDLVKAISDFSERGVCDRPEKHNIVLMRNYKMKGEKTQYKTDRSYTVSCDLNPKRVSGLLS